MFFGGTQPLIPCKGTAKLSKTGKFGEIYFSVHKIASPQIA